jgi:hypothetical protein
MYIALGGVLGFLVTAIFAWQSHYHKREVNLATWVSVFLLDIIGVVLTLLTRKPGDQFPVLQCAWSVAAAMMAVVAYKHRPSLIFSRTETVCLTVAVTATLVYILSRMHIVPASLWIVFYCAACTASVVPQVIDYAKNTQMAKDAERMWALTGCSLALSLLGVVVDDKLQVPMRELYKVTLVQLYSFLLLLNTGVMSVIYLRKANKIRLSA